MISGNTKSGFEFKISEEKLNDYELLELTMEVEENPQLITKIVDKLLGAQQKKALLDHLRTKKGNVPIDKVSAAIAEIFESVKQLKNSQSLPE